MREETLISSYGKPDGCHLRGGFENAMGTMAHALLHACAWKY